jgi:lipopolysaccharide biosynthesis glycosyltransferase
MQKVFIPEYVKDVNKAIYIDSDTIVQKDLFYLYNKNMNNTYIAGARDGLMFMYPEHIKEINLEWRDFYFNSGVMLLNLQKMRQDKFIEKSLMYFNNNYEVFADQDILNVVSKEKVKEISYIYNCNSTFFEENDAEFLSKFFKQEISNNPNDVYKKAVILHFAGHKPWTEWFNHPYLKPLWWGYAKELSAKYNIEELKRQREALQDYKAYKYDEFAGEYIPTESLNNLQTNLDKEIETQINERKAYLQELLLSDY